MPRIGQIATEHQEQKSFVDWLKLKHIPFYHIPNGGYRHKGEAREFKALGVQAGIPDICIPIARGGYHSLYIELKRTKGGKVSGKQSEWIAKLNELGHTAQVAHGALEAIEIVQHYFRL